MHTDANHSLRAVRFCLLDPLNRVSCCASATMRVCSATAPTLTGEEAPSATPLATDIKRVLVCGWYFIKYDEQHWYDQEGTESFVSFR